VVKGTYFGNQSNYYITLLSSTRVFFDVWSGGVRKSLEYGEGASLPGIDRTNWWHIASVYDGLWQIIYVNGGLGNRVSRGALSLDVDSSQLRIGKDDAYAAPVTVGEVRLYQRALTSLEVQQNYLATKWRYR